MKKGIIVFIILVVIACGVGAAVYFININKAEKTVENDIYGIVSSINDKTIQINSEGTKYSFNIQTASKPDVEIVEDDVVKVSYNGELKDSMDATKITIIKEVASIDSKDSKEEDTNKVSNATSTAANSTATKSSDETDDNADHYITGKVKAASMNEITITANIDGKDYSFNTQNAKKDSGIEIGDTVRIIHKGKVANQTDKQTVDAVYVHKLDTTKIEAVTEKSITGKVKDSSMNVLTIEANGKTYTFSTMTAEKASVIIGDTVKVTYKGTLSESSTITATKVEKE